MKKEKTEETAGKDIPVGMRIEQEYFTPALQEAARKASAEKFEPKDIISGAANAYMKMIMALTGGAIPAAKLFQKQAEHLAGLAQKK